MRSLKARSNANRSTAVTFAPAYGYWPCLPAVRRAQPIGGAHYSWVQEVTIDYARRIRTFAAMERIDLGEIEHDEAIARMEGWVRERVA